VRTRAGRTTRPRNSATTSTADRPRLAGDRLRRGPRVRLRRRRLRDPARVRRRGVPVGRPRRATRGHLRDARARPRALRIDLKARIDETLAANDLAEAYVKLYHAWGPARHARPAARGRPHRRRDREAPRPRRRRLDTGPRRPRRAPDDEDPKAPSSRALPADAKTHNYLNGILARLELRVTGADEALMLDPDGNVAEGRPRTSSSPTAPHSRRPRSTGRSSRA